MTAIIFYFARTPWDPTQHPILTDRGQVGFVRAELVEAEDLSAALDHARPRIGEIVLNIVAHLP